MGIEDTTADLPMAEEANIETPWIPKRKHHKPDQRHKRIKQKRQKRTIKRAAAK